MRIATALALAIYFFPVLVFASTTDGTIDATNKYAWSDRLGWVNLGTAGGNVHVTANGLTGYAWTANHGWINLSPAGSGVINNGQGDLSGAAWGEQIGYIDFSNVSIADGRFVGTASSLNGFGTITFDCDNCHVSTDWRPVTLANGGSASFTPAPQPITSSTPIATTATNPVAQLSIEERRQELATLIAKLQAQLAALLGSRSGNLPGSSCGPFLRNLATGDIHEDVRSLQRFLNNRGFEVAATGPGSPGSETNRFGAYTRAAVQAFQRARAIAPSSGFFGPLTRATVNSICGV